MPSTADNAGMDVRSVAAAITALQEGYTSRKEARQIAELFLGVTGPELTELKRLIDHGGDDDDLLAMLNVDVADTHLRARLVAHIRENAPPSGQLKVYSDIDDTFVSALKDKSFPKGTVYPGVRAFYTALDRGPQGNDPTGDLMFLSARPDALRGYTMRALAKAGVVEAGILPGRLADAATMNEAKRNQNFAATKVVNFKAHQALYPEYSAVFIGDSGQGDAIAGSAMNKLPSGRPKAVYIHNVTDMTPQQKVAMEADGIVVFDTPLEAAIDAYKKGLSSRDGLRAVRLAARAELEAMSLAPEQKAKADVVLSRAESEEAML